MISREGRYRFDNPVTDCAQVRGRRSTLARSSPYQTSRYLDDNFGVAATRDAVIGQPQNRHGNAESSEGFHGKVHKQWKQKNQCNKRRLVK